MVDPHVLRAYPISKFSYVSGYAAGFNGAELVADSADTVLVVVIQYRLGAFGTSRELTVSPQLV